MAVIESMAGVATAVLVGGMVFFAAVFAPLVFRHLSVETAASFIRRVFPVYYLAGAVLSGIAGVLSVPAMAVEGAVLLSIAAGFAIARQVLMPRINAFRDRELAGEADAAGPFKRLHRVSVILNMAQLIAAMIVLWRMLA